MQERLRINPIAYTTGVLDTLIGADLINFAKSQNLERLWPALEAQELLTACF
jgi:uncharacterized membrane protein